jgi:hypothetical protein
MSAPGGAQPTPGTMPLGQAPGHDRPRARPGDPGDRRPASARAPAPRPGRPRLTGRGATLVMLAVFLVGNLIAQAAHVPWLGGLSYVAGCLLAASYARREALLLVVTTPPLIFLISVVCGELITDWSATMLATAAGTLLTLAAVAPWLLAGTAGCVALAMVRGLPRCISDLRAGLAGRPVAAPAHGLPGPAQPPPDPAQPPSGPAQSAPGPARPSSGPAQF